jgi:hypothetical protein
LVGVVKGEESEGWWPEGEEEEESEQSSMNGTPERGTSLTICPDQVIVNRCSCFVTTNSVPAFCTKRNETSTSENERQWYHEHIVVVFVCEGSAPRHCRASCNQLRREV